MSRSYRSPYATDGYGSKWKKKEKRAANRAIRRGGASDGGAYKKEYNSWNICDYKFHCPENVKLRRK